MRNATLNRREWLAAAGLFAGTALWPETISQAPRVRVTGLELLPVRATQRTVWLIVRLRTDAGLTGIGEASDAFGFANTTREDAGRMRTELGGMFELVEGRSPLEIAAYRQRSRRLLGDGGLVRATAQSAVEQALWDLAGKVLDVPTHTLLGGSIRQTLPVYANINRATSPRTPDGFAAAARRALGDGFRAMKAAPWDGFPEPGSSEEAIETALENGIRAVAAMREAVGSGVDLMVDCHSFFDVEMASRVAQRLEPYQLAWYEEPVPPDRVAETVEIRRRISQPMAGGELLYGVSGFAPLIRSQAVDVIMPDVKHCGGLLELTHIAAMADAEAIQVAPHNPSGPVSTAASVPICAVIENFNFLEFQWGEVDWRAEVLDPPERFTDGRIAVSDRPGFGVRLNDSVVRAHLM